MLCVSVVVQFITRVYKHIASRKEAFGKRRNKEKNGGTAGSTHEMDEQGLYTRGNIPIHTTLM